MKTEECDNFFMRRCFELARKGAGFANPNPLVGCVIARGDEVLVEGWHARYGADHAEAAALNQAAEKNVDVRGATLYCNLEPCCHTNKQTPPCLPLVVNSAVKRVVIANSDPNPEVAGRSLKAMRQAGIEVREDCLAAEGRELNRFFFHWVQTGRPWVTLKMATTIDGKISTDRRKATAITGPAAMKQVHRMRHAHSAILVGRQTVESDNPRLTARGEGQRSPLRVVLDGALKSAPQARLFSGELPCETWLFYCSGEAEKKKQVFEQAKVKLIKTEEDAEGRVNLKEVLEYLGSHNVNSLLVEGGAAVFSSFLNEGLFNSLELFIAPKIMPEGYSAWRQDSRLELRLGASRMVGEDAWLTFYNKKI